MNIKFFFQIIFYLDKKGIFSKRRTEKRVAMAQETGLGGDRPSEALLGRRGLGKAVRNPG